MNGNPLLTALVGSQPNFMQIFEQFKKNPMQILAQRFNLPPQMQGGDPNAIINHLLTSGQISQEQLNAAYTQMQRMGFKR